MSKKVIVFIFFVCRPYSAFCEVERISEKEMDLSKPLLIYMTAGRSTMLDFPCEISHSVLSLTEDIKTTIGPDSKKTMTLWVSSDDSQPTCLTVKCDDLVYVFDILPNRHTHQDYINITESFDGRNRKSRILVDSSFKTSNSQNNLDRKLVLSSKSYQPKKNLSSGEILLKLNKNKNFKKLISSGEK